MTLIFDPMRTEGEVVYANSENGYSTLRNALVEHTSILVLTDQNTDSLCLNSFTKKIGIKDFYHHSIPAGEGYKNLGETEKLLKAMMNCGMDRKAALVNLGGGVVSDLGGFAASVYKRGIDFYNVPTTLLAMVDASHGGKTGLNVDGVKNQIGAFKHAHMILIDSDYLQSLPQVELLSGYAEVIKHALIADSLLWQDMLNRKSLDEIDHWHALILPSVNIKRHIVEKDPQERGWRKVLNFGHSIGHALESYLNSINRNLSHGHAVAIGMVCESYISYKRGFLAKDEWEVITDYIAQFFSAVELNDDDRNQVLNYLTFDKKNESEVLNFSLLQSIGKAVYDENVSREEALQSLNTYQKIIQ